MSELIESQVSCRQIMSMVVLFVLSVSINVVISFIFA